MDIEWNQYQQSAIDYVERLGVSGNVVVASLTVVVGFVIALLGRHLVRRWVRRGGRLLSSWTDAESPTTARVERVFGATVYWGVLLFAIMTATEILGLPVVTGWLTHVASYIPRLVAAVLILAVGTIIARVGRQLTRRAARSAQLPGAERMGHATEIAILVASTLVAIEQLGIEISFLKIVLIILLAATLGGAGLAFGLGGRELVANVLSAHYLQRTFRVGQRLRMEGVEGRIIRITEVAVIVETSDGETVVPAGEFARRRSTVVLRAGAQ